MTVIGTTTGGTTVSIRHAMSGATHIILDNPEAPAEFRNQEVGRIVGPGFQPVPYAEFSMSAECLRIIADHIDATTKEN